MPARASSRQGTYDYAWLRVVPRVETGEYVTVGVILFCRTRRFLGARLVVDRARLAALWPALDLDEVQRHLDLFPALCRGEGPIGGLGKAEVFHWIVAPHSTMIQASPVHSGLCEDPETALNHLASQIGRDPEARAGINPADAL